MLLAVEGGNHELIQLLLDKGASLEARDSRGLNALMLAVTNERQDVRSVRLLLDRGARADVQAIDNQSALSWARKWGRDTEIVRLLKEHGGRVWPPLFESNVHIRIVRVNRTTTSCGRALHDPLPVVV